MGLSQVSAALYSRDEPLSLESFPIIGFHKSYSHSDLITDSAAGATAFACGIKTYNNAIGVDPDTLARLSILEEAEQKGMATGLIATLSITHATPASFAAHQPMRIFYERIAEDMAKQNIDLLIGGGKKYFDRRENDDQNLIDTLLAHNSLVSDFLSADIDRIRPDIDKNFIFFTADKHPLPVSHGRTYLGYASSLACRFLHAKNKDKGFFLMIEGSQIDWANHANEGTLMVEETLDFDYAVGEVLDFAKKRGNTLVIVTADHESGGAAVHEKTKRGKMQLFFTTNGHTAALVPVYAYGPNAETFSGIYENTALYHKMRAFLGWKK